MDASLSDLKFDSNGLIPAIIQDFKSGEVLMMAWMNADSLQKTVETGKTQIVSRREFARLAARIEEWQQNIMELVRDADLDIVRIGLDRWEMETALCELLVERRLRKI